MEKNTLSTGSKVWLWLMIAGSIISIISGLIAVTVSFTIGVYSIIAGIIQLASVVTMLFKQKKEGFYILCGVVVINFIFNITYNVSTPLALISGFASIAITYLLVYKQLNGN